jgi:hypothetical protein
MNVKWIDAKARAVWRLDHPCCGGEGQLVRGSDDKGLEGLAAIIGGHLRGMYADHLRWDHGPICCNRTGNNRPY